MLISLVYIQIVLYFFRGRGASASGDHVAIVQCSSHTECLNRINDELRGVIEANMNNDTSPCVNFWDYACGKWTAAPYYDHVDNFGAVGNFYAQQMEQVLSVGESQVEHALPNLMSKLKSYYQACSKAGNYYLDLAKYLYDDEPIAGKLNIADILAGNVTKDFDWLSVTANLRSYGVNGIFFEQSVGVAFNDSKVPVIELKMPSSEDRLPNAHKLLQTMIDFGWSDELKVSQREIGILQNVYVFSVQLREIREKHKADEEELLLLKDFIAAVPNIDWPTYFSTVMPAFNPNVVIEVESLTYLRDLANFLAQSDVSTISLYILMSVCGYVKQIAPQITSKNCAIHTTLMFPLAMNYICDRWVYKTRQQDQLVLLEMFGKLKRQFEKYLHANKLQLKATQLEYLHEKLHKMQFRLGNLPADPKLNDSYYDHYYDTTNISAENFFANHWEMLRFRAEVQHRVLLESNGHLDLLKFYVNDDIDQLRTAPYFVHQRNLLIVPMIFLQMPFFHHSLSPLLQYSLMGWILGHELNHGFEMEGITVDANGIDSVIGQSISEWPQFTDSVECLKTRPTASVVERIADINGFQLAYDTYFSSNLSDNDSKGKQLFFLNFAQFFCGNLPRAVQHDRDDVRVLEVVRNMREFAEAFNCGVSYNEEPCEMWRL